MKFSRVKTISALSSSTRTITSGLSKMGILSNSLANYNIQLKEAMPKIKDAIKDADTIGSKALKENILTPGECLQKFYPGKKRTEEQIKLSKMNAVEGPVKKDKSRAIGSDV